MMRQRMKRWLVLLICVSVVGVQWLVVPARAYACSCAFEATPKEATDRAVAVFAGTVTRIRTDNNYWSRVFGNGYPENIATLTVTEVWKGEVEPTKVVATATQSSACGFDFQEGVDYLVFAGGSGEALQINICSRTATVASAGADLGALGVGDVPTGNAGILHTPRNITLVSLAILLGGGFIVWLSRRKNQQNIL